VKVSPPVHPEGGRTVITQRPVGIIWLEMIGGPFSP
jgi:hypothetical protein